MNTTIENAPAPLPTVITLEDIRKKKGEKKEEIENPGTNDENHTRPVRSRKTPERV